MADSQKFIARNRAPRVQIEYDVEVYGSEKKIQLPFVMGVMSDLSGKSEVSPGALEDRSFMAVDVDNFDSRMKAMKPRVAVAVPNTLTGEGNLNVDITFEKMSDFAPGAIAAKVEPLRKLLEARTQLSNLMTYMDGKAGAEDMILSLLQNPDQFRALVGGGSNESITGVDAVLGALKDASVAVPEEVSDSGTDKVLESLAAAAPADDEPDTSVDDALDAIRSVPLIEEVEETGDNVLAALVDQGDTVEETVDTTTDDVLTALADEQPKDADPDDGVDDLLGAIAEAAPDEVVPEETTDALLTEMAVAGPDQAPPDETTDALLAELADAAAEEEQSGEDADDILDDLASEALDEEVDAGTDIDALLEDVSAAAEEKIEDDTTDNLLAELAETGVEEDHEEDDLDALLAEVADVEEDPEATDQTDDVLAALGAEDGFTDDLAGGDDLDALLADVADQAPVEPETTEDDLDALLADVADVEADSVSDEDGDLEALLADVADGSDEFDNADDDLDALLSDVAEQGDAEPEADEEDVDLDALLADVDEEIVEDSDKADADLDFDELLGGDGEETDDLDALLADVSEDEAEASEDDLDALLADADAAELDLEAPLDGDESEFDNLQDTAAEQEEPAEKPKIAYNPAFGTISAAKPQINPGDRRKMRIAILGDFSGRANQGDLQIGADLAGRKPIKFDVDSYEDVIARFATSLTLPLGNDGSAVAVELNELDELHPDELYDNVELFSELATLRSQVQQGVNLDSVVGQLQGWGQEFGDFRLTSKARAKGSKANTTLAVSDFESLIGGTVEAPKEPTGINAMIQRVVAPFVVDAPDAEQESMLTAVDQALSAAMSSILHHPDFQAVEANWRSLEMLARRVETGSHLELVLYDVAVEEFTADLAAQEDLSGSGLYDMLVERPRLDEAQGPLAAVFGLYTFEETPPHAELLARMSQISAHMDAPFVAAIGPGFLNTKVEDLNPLISKTWDALRGTPQAKYIGLASPRFLLRMPYGKKTDPVDPFAYEEFNVKEGLRSLLMGNPVVLAAVLLAETLNQQGSDISLGSVMSVDDMPFHYMTDQYGDQIALPSTERLINVRMSADTITRGFMPVLSIQGQNVVRLGSFNAVGGGELLGLWSGEEAKSLSSGKIRARTGVSLSAGSQQPEASTAAPNQANESDDEDFELGGDDGFDLGGDDDFDLGDDEDLDLGGDDEFDLGLDTEDDFDVGGDGDLDDLLADFDDDGTDDGGDEEMDADLAALLGDL